MKILLLLSHLIAFSIADRLVKIEETSGGISDIVIDRENTWYIVKDQSLYYSLDKAKTLNKIELPSKESVYPGLGIDRLNNIYVQDHNLSVFIVAPALERTFVTEEVTLAYGKEKIESRPFSLTDLNIVYFATKTGLMKLKNGFLICEPMASAPNTAGSITHMVPQRNSDEKILYSGGNTRHWVFLERTDTDIPIIQTKSFVKYMSDGLQNTFFIVNGEKTVRLIDNMGNSKIIQGIDASYIDDKQVDFLTFSRESREVYIFNNINSTGMIYKIVGKQRYIGGYHQFAVGATLILNNIHVFCAARNTRHDSEIYFGTSDGIYQLENGKDTRVEFLSIL